MQEKEFLEKLKRCAVKAQMQIQIDVALDEDEDSDYFFEDGYLFLDNHKTKFTSEDVKNVKYKHYDYEDDYYNGFMSYVIINFNDESALYIFDSFVCEDESVIKYQYKDKGTSKYVTVYGADAFEKMM